MSVDRGLNRSGNDFDFHGHVKFQIRTPGSKMSIFWDISVRYWKLFSVITRGSMYLINWDFNFFPNSSHNIDNIVTRRYVSNTSMILILVYCVLWKLKRQKNSCFSFPIPSMRKACRTLWTKHWCSTLLPAITTLFMSPPIECIWEPLSTMRTDFWCIFSFSLFLPVTDLLVTC